MATKDQLNKHQREIYDVVRRIPRGRVATYGQIAELSGRPGAARLVGAAMRSAGEARIPWQRVVGKRGKRLAQVSIQDPVGGAVQRKILEGEGIEFTEGGAIRLDVFGWLPL